MEEYDILVSQLNRLETKMDTTLETVAVIRERVSKVEVRSGMIATFVAALVSFAAALITKMGFSP